MRSHDLGRRSEDLACSYLTTRGWAILARNYRAGHKEIDIIALSGGTVAFVEVKARTSAEYGHPLHAITWQKQREVAYAARVWLALHPGVGHECRFDAVTVLWTGESHEVEHLENAWRIR